MLNKIDRFKNKFLTMVNFDHQGQTEAFLGRFEKCMLYFFAGLSCLNPHDDGGGEFFFFLDKGKTAARSAAKFAMTIPSSFFTHYVHTSFNFVS